MDLKQKCSECGESGVGPWLSMCPYCGQDIPPLLSVDDEGFLCELNGDKILDDTHWILDFCKEWEWQAFCVSRDGNGNIRGLRRTCEEWDDNSNKGWCFARKTVSTGNPSSFARTQQFANKCAKILKSSLFHAWPCVHQRYPGEFETDYYVGLGLKNGEDITPGSFVIEKDTLEFVKKALQYSETGDTKVDELLTFIDELDIVECLGKERPSDFDLSRKLVDRWSIPLIMLKSTDKSKLDEIFKSDARKKETKILPAFKPGFLNK